MGLLARPRVRIIITSFGLSKTSRCTPYTPKNNVVCLYFSTITNRTAFEAQYHFKSKEKPSRGFYMPSHFHLCYNGIAPSWLRNVIPKPCRDSKQSVRARSTPSSQDPLTHVDLLFTWGPTPLRSSKLSFKKLATSTKICTSKFYTQTHTRGFITRSCARLLIDASVCNSSQVSATR